MLVCVCVCPYVSIDMYMYGYLYAMHPNAYHVEGSFAWLHYESSVCCKSPPEHI